MNAATPAETVEMTVERTPQGCQAKTAGYPFPTPIAGNERAAAWCLAHQYFATERSDGAPEPIEEGTV